MDFPNGANSSPPRSKVVLIPAQKKKKNPAHQSNIHPQEVKACWIDLLLFFMPLIYSLGCVVLFSSHGVTALVSEYVHTLFASPLTSINTWQRGSATGYKRPTGKINMHMLFRRPDQTFCSLLTNPECQGAYAGQVSTEKSERVSRKKVNFPGRRAERHQMTRLNWLGWTRAGGEGFAFLIQWSRRHV